MFISGLTAFSVIVGWERLRDSETFLSDGRFGLLGKGVVDALVNVVYLGPLVVSEDVVTAIVLAVSVEGVVSIDFMDLGVS